MATTTKKIVDEAPRDPVGPAVEPVKVVTIEEQGIGARDPYPTGNPPVPPDNVKGA